VSSFRGGESADYADFRRGDALRRPPFFRSRKHETTKTRKSESNLLSFVFSCFRDPPSFLRKSVKSADDLRPSSDGDQPCGVWPLDISRRRIHRFSPRKNSVFGITKARNCENTKREKVALHFSCFRAFVIPTLLCAKLRNLRIIPSGLSGSSARRATACWRRRCQSPGSGRRSRRPLWSWD
jgi:hypothetical protein